MGVQEESNDIANDRVKRINDKIEIFITENSIPESYLQDSLKMDLISGIGYYCSVGRRLPWGRKRLSALREIIRVYQDFALGGTTPADYEKFRVALAYVNKNSGFCNTVQMIRNSMALEQSGPKKNAYNHYSTRGAYSTSEDINGIVKTAVYPLTTVRNNHNQDFSASAKRVPCIMKGILEQILLQKGSIMQTDWLVPLQERWGKDCIWNVFSFDKEEIVSLGYLPSHKLPEQIKKMSKFYENLVTEYGSNMLGYATGCMFPISINAQTYKGHILTRVNNRESAPIRGVEVSVTSKDEKYIDAFFENLKVLSHKI